MIKFKANSKELQIESPVSVVDFLKERGLSPGSVIVELNGVVLDREAFGETLINEGDSLELIRAYAGG